jgi:carbonic anhydrase/acetyltransferase-like protein (isoleucine patch superfamily)
MFAKKYKRHFIIHRRRGNNPMLKIHPSSFIAPSAVLIGNITIGRNCGVFPHTVIRGDENSIIIEDGSNVQDCCVIHTDAEHQVNIGKNVSIGHAAVVHGATISDDCLIGIHATVLNGARIGSGSIIGACALVTEGMVVPEHSLVLGIPGKVVKQDPQYAVMIRKNAEIYQKLSLKHTQKAFEVYPAEEKNLR